MILKNKPLENWAKTQKRITVRRIREGFDTDDEMAQQYYDYLKRVGIIGRMGFVNEQK